MDFKHILIIDTSKSGIDLFCDNISKHIDTDKQSLSLPTETEKFITENNLRFADLDAIGVVVGPGSFTGIRLGIAYAKGLAMGLNIPIVPINAFEIYMEKNPNAFVAIDSGRSDLFVAAHDIKPCTMDIDEIETKQMNYAKTVGHKPYDLGDGAAISTRKLNSGIFDPVVPMYLRPSYAEINKCLKA